MPPSPVEQFQEILQMGVTERVRALNPPNAICALPLSKPARKVIERELTIFRDLLMQYELLLGVE